MRPQRRLPLLLLVALVIGGTVPGWTASGETATGAAEELEGRLLRSAGGRSEPAAGVSVRLDETGQTTRTTADGRFRFAGLSPGRYHLAAERNGLWIPIGAATATSPTGTAAIDFTLGEADDTITVVARRQRSTLLAAPEAVRVVTGEELETYAARDLADALRRAPGLQFYDVGGTEAEPAVNVRGFTGGGENDYLLVLVDGMRVNDLGNGRVDWRELDLENVERVEVLRGPMSALYGDASVGGVVEVTTRRSPGRTFDAALVSGSHGELGGRLAAGLHPRDGLGLDATLSTTQSDGWRQRSRLEDVRASLRLQGLGAAAEGTSWGLRLWARGDDHEVPGPLPAARFERDPEAAGYDSDRIDRERLALSGLGTRHLGSWRLEGQAALRHQDDTQVETLLIETKERRFAGDGLWAELRGHRDFAPGGSATPRLSLGLETLFGSYRSDYFDVDTEGRGGLQTADGDGDRTALGGYAQLELDLTDRVELQLGVRVDRIEDDFSDRLLPDADAASEHDAVSPRIGLLWSISTRSSAYASLGRSFKAPTPFQLYDQRRPFGIPITNPSLEPLDGKSITVGYRSLGRRLHVDLSLYWLELENEIGFDPIAFRTDNIGRSRHRGAELFVAADLGRGFDALLSYTLTDARFRAGDFSGNRIDNVPRHSTAIGVRYGDAKWTASLAARDVRSIFLDPAESVRLADHTTVDATVSRRIAGFELRLEGLNLLDESYASWGFVSPLDGISLLYPALARTFRITLRHRWGS